MSFRLIVLIFALTACDTSRHGEDSAISDTGATTPDATTDGAGTDTGPRLEDTAALPLTRWRLVRTPEEPTAIQEVMDELKEHLSLMGVAPEVVEQDEAPACIDGEVSVFFQREGVKFSQLEVTDQTWGILHARCGDGHAIVVYGGGLLGRQYAGYQLLHVLGVRFFHPMETFLPPLADPEKVPNAIERTPSIPRRSVQPRAGAIQNDGLDGTAPDEGKAYLLWQLRNLASEVGAHLSDGALNAWAAQRGLKRRVKLQLYGDAASPGVVDPDDDSAAPWATTLEALLASATGKSMRIGSVVLRVDHALEKEISPAKLRDTLDGIAVWFESTDPAIAINVIVPAHLPEFPGGVALVDVVHDTNIRLGVVLETALFYDLTRPAPPFAGSAMATATAATAALPWRRLGLQVSGAHPGLVDIELPMSLPIGLETISADLALLPGAGLSSFTSRSSGLAWTFWAREYCGLRGAAEVDAGLAGCLAALTSPFGAEADAATLALTGAIEAQLRDLVHGELLPWLVGPNISIPNLTFSHRTDVESLFFAGMVALEAWQEHIGSHLIRLGDDLSSATSALAALESKVPTRSAPWLAEWIDALESSASRARHAGRLYGALVDARKAQLRYRTDHAPKMAAGLAASQDTTHQALAVVKRREHRYRYTPTSRLTASGAPLHDASTVAAYREEDGQVMAWLEATTSNRVTLASALIGPDETLQMAVVDPEDPAVSVSFGDGATAPAAKTHSHSYTTPGVYTVKTWWSDGDEALASVHRVVRMENPVLTGFSGAITSPIEANLLDPFLPALVLGWVSADTLVLGYLAEEEGPVKVGHFSLFSCEVEGLFATCTSPRLLVPVVTNGVTAAGLMLFEAKLVLDFATGATSFTGVVPTSILVDMATDLVGFEPEDARDTIASLLGFTVDEIPDSFTLTVAYSFPVEEEGPPVDEPPAP